MIFSYKSVLFRIQCIIAPVLNAASKITVKGCKFLEQNMHDKQKQHIKKHFNSSERVYNKNEKRRLLTTHCLNFTYPLLCCVC